MMVQSTSTHLDGTTPLHSISQTYFLMLGGIKTSFKARQNASRTCFSQYTLLLLVTTWSWVVILYGIDSDSFINNSGNIFYSKAQEILNLANQSGFSNTWQSVNSGGRINKFWLIENLNSSSILALISHGNTYRPPLTIASLQPTCRQPVQAYSLPVDNQCKPIAYTTCGQPVSVNNSTHETFMWCIR